MADRSRPAPALAAFIAVLGLLAVGASITAAGQTASDHAGRPSIVAAPADDPCDSLTPPPGVTENPCKDRGGGGGVGGLGGLVVVVGVIIAAGILALVAVYLVLRRRASGPFAPADPGEWWTCRNCGKSNVIGSPRCFSCATWQA